MKFIFRNHFLPWILIAVSLLACVGGVRAENLEEAAAKFPELRGVAAVKLPDSMDCHQAVLTDSIWREPVFKITPCFCGVAGIQFIAMIITINP